MNIDKGNLIVVTILIAIFFVMVYVAPIETTITVKHTENLLTRTYDNSFNIAEPYNWTDEGLVVGIMKEVGEINSTAKIGFFHNADESYRGGVFISGNITEATVKMKAIMIPVSYNYGELSSPADLEKKIYAVFEIYFFTDNRTAVIGMYGGAHRDGEAITTAEIEAGHSRLLGYGYLGTLQTQTVDFAPINGLAITLHIKQYGDTITLEIPELGFDYTVSGYGHGKGIWIPFGTVQSITFTEKVKTKLIGTLTSYICVILVSTGITVGVIIFFLVKKGMLPAWEIALGDIIAIFVVFMILGSVIVTVYGYHHTITYTGREVAQLLHVDKYWEVDDGIVVYREQTYNKTDGYVPIKNLNINKLEIIGSGEMWFTIGAKSRDNNILFLEESESEHMLLLSSIERGRSEGGNYIMLINRFYQFFPKPDKNASFSMSGETRIVFDVANHRLISEDGIGKLATDYYVYPDKIREMEVSNMTIETYTENPSYYIGRNYYTDQQNVSVRGYITKVIIDYFELDMSYLITVFSISAGVSVLIIFYLKILENVAITTYRRGEFS